MASLSSSVIRASFSCWFSWVAMVVITEKMELLYHVNVVDDASVADKDSAVHDADLPGVPHAVPPKGLVIEGVQLVTVLRLQGTVQRAARGQSLQGHAV